MTNSKIGRKILVIGSPGSGKTVFSRQLAEISKIPLVHLDQEYWQDYWMQTPHDEWIKRQAILTLGDEWILDGNYGSTLDIRMEKADTIICFALSRLVCLKNYLKRVVQNSGKARPELPQTCIEKVDITFMKYIWDFPTEWGKRNKERLAICGDKRIIIFTKREEVREFLKELKNP